LSKSTPTDLKRVAGKPRRFGVGDPRLEHVAASANAVEPDNFDRHAHGRVKVKKLTPEP